MTQVLEMVYNDPFFHGYCPVKNWKKTKKRYREHHYEILDPVQVGSFMEFKFISQKDYMRLLRDIFVEGVQSA